MRLQSPTFEDRFWAKVTKTKGCWLWKAATNVAGYGKLYAHVDEMGRTHTIDSHRASWAIHFGEVPDGLMVLHRCDNPTCVRPDHLFLGTGLDNVLDCHSKGRAYIKPRVTHCARGHELTAENLIVSKSSRRPGGINRCCRVCNRVANTAAASKRRSAPEQRAAYNAYQREWRRRQKAS
jgi:hypothetical protein